MRIDIHHHFHIEVGSEVVALIKQQFDLIKETIVSAADDLVTEITGKLEALASEISTEIRDLAAAISAGTITPASLDGLRAISARIGALTTDLQADNPAPAPTP